MIAGIGTSDWSRNARAAGAGTLTSGRTTTRVRLTEVTDPALKERVVVAFGTENRAQRPSSSRSVSRRSAPRRDSPPRSLRRGLRGHSRGELETLAVRFAAALAMASSARSMTWALSNSSPLAMQERNSVSVSWSRSWAAVWRMRSASAP